MPLPDAMVRRRQEITMQRSHSRNPSNQSLIAKHFVGQVGRGTLWVRPIVNRPFWAAAMPLCGASQSWLQPAFSRFAPTADAKVSKRRVPRSWERVFCPPRASPVCHCLSLLFRQETADR